MARNICRVQGCTKEVVAHKLCDMHRKRLKRHGHLMQTRSEDWGQREKHPLYNTWCWMKRMQHKASIASQWMDFWKFVEDVKERPSPKHQLRRIDSHDGYNPSNCKWVETIPDQDRAEYMKEWNKKNPEKVKNNDLLKRHGITLEDYQQMYKAQNGVCAICGRKESCDGYSLAVDHCHETKKIRGLLCRKCNTGIGLFHDSTELLAKAIEYLH